MTKVEVKQVDLPQELQGAIARQAEAERERRAKIINADGEYQAAEKLKQAAAVMEERPISITLRYLQTLTEIGVEKNTTIVFPLPVDLFADIIGKATQGTRLGGDSRQAVAVANPQGAGPVSSGQ